MAEHANIRTATESQIKEALAAVFVKYGRLSNEAIPWHEFELELQAVLDREAAAAFFLLYMATLDTDPGLTLLLPQGELLGKAAGQQWGSMQGRLTARPLITNFRDAVAKGRVLSDVATVARAEGIAATETTRTITAAERSVYSSGRSAAGLAGEQPGVWHCERGACEICYPLDGTDRDVWGVEFPDGPPSPHPWCRCWIEWFPLAVDNPAAE